MCHQWMEPNGLPAIVTGAVVGILINAVFLIFKPPVVAAAGEEMAVATD